MVSRNDIDWAMSLVDDGLRLKAEDPVRFFAQAFGWEIIQTDFESVAYMDNSELEGAVCADLLQAAEIDIPLNVLNVARHVKCRVQQGRVLDACERLLQRGIIDFCPYTGGFVIPKLQLPNAYNLAGIGFDD